MCRVSSYKANYRHSTIIIIITPRYSLMSYETHSILTCTIGGRRSKSGICLPGFSEKVRIGKKGSLPNTNTNINVMFYIFLLSSVHYGDQKI
jgi:hypothetical protein